MLFGAQPAGMNDPGELFHFRKVFFQGRSNRRRAGTIVNGRTALDGKQGINSVNVGGAFVLSIVAELIVYVHDNVQTANRSERKPQDVDEGKGFVPGEIAYGNFKKIDHRILFYRSYSRTSIMPFT